MLLFTVALAPPPRTTMPFWAMRRFGPKPVTTFFWTVAEVGMLEQPGPAFRPMTSIPFFWKAETGCR